MVIRYKVTKSRRSYPGNIHPLNYPKDETVMSPNGFGIFVYKRRKDAEDYLQHSTKNAGYTQRERSRIFQILRVKTIGKGKKLTLCPTADEFSKGIEVDKILRLSRRYRYYPLLCIAGTVSERKGTKV